MRYLSAVIGVCVLLLGCGGGGERSVPNSKEQYQALRIAPLNSELRTGTKSRFVAVGFRADQTAEFSWDLRSPVSSAMWKSSSPAILSIDALGNFTAQSGGSATVTGSLGTLINSTVVTVSDSVPALVQVGIWPGLAKFGSSGAAVGQQFQAVAEYDDQSTKDVTSDGIWVSSNPGIIAIDSSGWATYKSPGDCTITFFYGLSYNNFRVVR